MESLIQFRSRIARWRVERRLASKKNEAWRLKGAAWDSAFSAQMFAANPELSTDTRRAYEALREIAVDVKLAHDLPVETQLAALWRVVRHHSHIAQEVLGDA